MDFKKTFKNVFDMFLLKEKAIKEIAKTIDGFWIAVGIILVGSLISVIPGLINPIKSPLTSFSAMMPGVLMVVLSIFVFPILAVVFTLISAGVIHLIAKMFGGSGSYKEFFTLVGHTQLIAWFIGGLTIIATIFGLIHPIIDVVFSVLFGIVSFLLWIWALVVLVIVIKVVQKLSVGKAVGVVLVSIAVWFIIVFLLAAIIASFLFMTNLGSAVPV